MARLLAGLLLVLSCMGCAAQSRNSGDIPINKELIGKLQAWIERETGYKAANQPIVVSSTDKFRQVMALNGALLSSGVALYIPGMIVLNNDDGGGGHDVVEISLLLHELVHHAQLFSKKQYQCNNAKEYEAYTLQNKWLAQQGESAFASRAWIMKMAYCDTPDPPALKAWAARSDPADRKNSVKKGRKAKKKHSMIVVHPQRH
ncbi:MAG: DUF6647 family protein [Alphaproteobacteria bacterium]